jgi:hypothetical protein
MVLSGKYSHTTRDGYWVVSRPGNFTPAPLRTVRETLASHRSHQTNQPFNVNG